MTAAVLETPRRAAAGCEWSGELSSIALRYGAGCFDELGAVARELGGRRALVVSDPGITAVGYPARAVESLAREGVDAWVFDAVGENPTTAQVDAGVEAASRRDVDLLIGLGGGSAMDCAKGINFLLTNGGRMADYWGFGKARQPLLPSIGVPTTAGTGSEAQSYALISDPETHRKMACGDRKARFRTVLLDPELLTTTPPAVAAATAVDAMAHAVESAVTRTRTPISDLLARDAWSRLTGSFETALGLGESGEAERLAALGEMLIGAHWAGAAIEASMLGAAHAAANPLTARFGVVHGLAVGLMLPAVVRYNAAQVGSIYAELLGEPGADPRQAGETLAARLQTMFEKAGLPASLQAAGIPRDVLPELAAAARQEWTGGFNPRPLNDQEFLDLYEASY